MNDDTVGIACDWGTSNLRVYRLGPNAKIIEKRDFPAGITAIKNKKFEDTFVKATQDWLDEYTDIPITISGMAGSRQGWKEAPYLPCPANVLTIANNLTPIRLRSGQDSLVNARAILYKQQRSTRCDARRGSSNSWRFVQYQLRKNNDLLAG